MYILVNEGIIPRSSFSVDIEDRGYQFGDGIYEMVKVFEGVLFEWEAHLQRLFRSARELRITISMNKEELTEQVQRLIAIEDLRDGYVYIQVTREVASRIHHFPEGVSSVLVAYTKEGKEERKEELAGIRVITTEDIRWQRVDIKSLNLLGNVLAKQKAVEAGAQEAVFVRDGMVTECSSSNIFGIKDGVCFTHPANHLILNGITRQVVIRLLEKVSLELEESPMKLEALYGMDEVFITNTGQEVGPVIEIDGRKVGNGDIGVYSRNLSIEFQRLIDSVVPSKR
ncbi:D-amino-acid transaminase [Bacillus sp. 522_BSPC]|uniref:D-amino-acid transaminase n=1 Tax=Bacillus sp. 522_BSPC TaxID=1579338 RepID=UPI00065FFF95|nr:D-amino-acid transaminase [Bacillus sp. 522_BSPC]